MKPSHLKQYIAAKAIIKNTDGKILVLRQSFEKAVDGAGLYHPPGGIVEPGETLHETVIREVKEETQLDVKVGEVLAVEEWNVNIRGDDCYFVGIFFECSFTDGAAIHVEKDEVSGFAWIDESSISEFEILEPSKKVIEDLFYNTKSSELIH